MRFSARNRNASRLCRARPAVAWTLICCLAAGCTNPGATPQRDQARDPASSSRPVATPSPTPSFASHRPSSSPGPSRTPSADPDSRDPARFAAELDRASTTLRDKDSPETEVTKAAEFQQLALRNLAGAPKTFRAAVIKDLDRTTAKTTRAQIKAAQALATISYPVHSLPDWRIVHPAAPDDLLRCYREAQRRTGVDWSYLAAIQFVETRMGRIRGASSAGALGPMQFTRATWQTYGNGGDINDNRDAIQAAARLLKANGADHDMDTALWHYNPAAGYVRAVEIYAATMRASVSAHYGYWHWQVIYSYDGRSFILPVGYPEKHAIRLPEPGK